MPTEVVSDKKISAEKLFSLIAEIVEDIRSEHIDDIYQFMAEGHSEHDCVEINSKVAEKLRRHGCTASLVRLPDVKHFIVEARATGRVYYADAVPELSGLFDHVLPSGFVGDIEELRRFYKI